MSRSSRDRRAPRTAGLLWLCLLASAPAAAGTFTAFGPETYRRDTGAPVTIVKSFSVLNPNTSYVLRVHNGGMEDGDFEKVSSSTITMNGTEVLGPNDLNQNVTIVEKPVTLRSANEIAVQVRGKPGGAIAVEVIGTDNDPPTITARADPPANGNGWNNTNVTVTFTCSDATSGIASCTAPVTVADEGAGQVVTGTAVDKAGNTATTSVRLSIDKTPPSVTATASPPANGNGWNNTDVTVGFACTDTLSGVDACPAAVTVTTEGAGQSVTQTAVDRAGNQASASVTLSIDKTPPTITATPTPGPNGNGWNNTDVVVSFTCTDGGSQVATCLPPVTVTAEGQGQVVAGTAADQAGNSASASATVSLDRTPPSLTVTFPADGASVSASPVSVTGSSEDGLSGLDHVFCNGTPSLGSGPPFSCLVPLTQGANPITVESLDRAGNRAARSLTVNFLVTPKVTITSPAPLALFRAGPVTVTGTVDRPVASVIVNGVPASLSGQDFTAPGVPLREGHNLLTATAADAAGNVGSGSVTVTLDSTPPTVRIDAPTEGAVVTAAQVTVTGMINDIVSGTVNAEQATVTVNGVPAAVSNRSFVANDVLLTRGLNTLTAVARDRAGNESQTQVHVTFQDVAGQQRIVMLSGNNQTGTIGATLPDPLTIAVLDAFGRPLPGRPVTFTVARTDGTVKAFPDEGRSVTVVSDDRGQASVIFRLGTRTGAGNNQVAVTSPGFVGEVMFCASATVAPPVRMNADAVMGESFRGVAGAPLAAPFVTIVFDEGGNPVAGVPVTFTVTGGGGSLEGETALVRATDSDGKAAATLTLGPDAGINNNLVTATFEGLPGPPVVFTASAAAPGPAAQTTVSGIVVDNANQPIPGATAKIVGRPLQAVTNEHGQFTIAGAPVGALTLIVDGSTSTRPETFPFLAFQMGTIAGQDNTIGMPIYLPPLETENSKIVGGDREVVLSMSNVPGVAFTVAPHSVTFPSGARVGPLTLSQVHADKVPMPPPYGSAPRIVWTLQPAGAHFDPPIRVQLPNTDGLPPGQVIEVFQFDHDIEQFVSVGPARVSEDGSVIVSDAGFGITKSGWGGAPPPPPPRKPCVSSCDDKKPCTDDRCVDGQCVHTRNIPPGEACHKVEIEAQFINQDDPDRTTYEPLGGGVVYGGSQDNTADNLKLKAIADPGGDVTVTDYSWSVEGGSYGSSTSQEWEVGEIRPEPAQLKFKVVVNFSDGETGEASKDIEVGVRSDDVVAIGWIDPNNVPLNAAGVTRDVLQSFPPGGAGSLSTADKVTSAGYLFFCLAAGIDITPISCVTLYLNPNPGGFPPPLTYLTAADKTYLLNWLFKYAANYCPKCPPTSFSNNQDVENFRNRTTSYKLINRLQIKYKASGGTFKGAPEIVRRANDIGVTNDPIFGREDRGDAGPANGRFQVFNSNVASRINDGTPTSIAVKAFNTLARPLKWSHIGSRIEQGVPYGTGNRLFTQVYPTYWVFENLSQTQTVPQAPAPIGNFSTNPYPPGPAPFIP